MLNIQSQPCIFFPSGLNIAVPQYLLQNVKATLLPSLQGWSDIEKYPLYRDERALTPAEEFLFVVCFGHELIHADLEFMRKGWQHISASQQGLSLMLLLAPPCLCFTYLTNGCSNSCRCNRCLLVCVGSVQFPPKFRRKDIFAHSWSGVWRGKYSVLKWNGIFVKILKRMDPLSDLRQCCTVADRLPREKRESTLIWTLVSFSFSWLCLLSVFYQLVIHPLINSTYIYIHTHIFIHLK